MIIKNKNGELTTQQIVVLIILITSFAVILFLLFRLNLGKTTDKELCYNSVVMKGNSVLPGDKISLNCKTNYLCITKDGSCEKMTKPEIKKVKTKNDVYEALADEMADCWWMFGEGKVNYVEKGLLSSLYCSICSQVAFDDSVQEILGKEIDETDFYKYLSDAKISGKDISYSEYLMGIKEFKDIEKVLSEEDINFGKINLDNQQYIVMGITSEISKLKWAAIGAVGGLVLAPFLGVGVVVGAIIVVAGGVGGNFVGMTVEGLSGNDYLSPSIIEVNSDEFKSLDCKSVTTLA